MLKAKVEVLQQSQRDHKAEFFRHLLGEDLGQLGTKELDQLERKLDTTLKQVRSTKTQYMLDQLSELQQKEETLVEVNKALTRKLEESTAATQPPWAAEEQNVSYRRQPAQPEGFFEPLECNNTLQIGYNAVVPDHLNVGTSTPSPSGVIPGWML
ncbi:hypothetical protein RJ639_027117 [Escallonia herrerae]|uniref:K-box domain-containing protein n=1 Tax=Escallonia herrerae TaxID=1293975 RepID=A0AA88X5K2_9ASTE|nr:hypothetical protein RJ639_027117 [Escallonia herrerae]